MKVIDLGKVHGTRFTDKYLQMRNLNSGKSYSSFTPATPPRSPTIRSLSPTGSPKASAGSPPRKVVTEFAAFGAPANVSVFGTAVASTPFSLAGGKAAFGGMRNSGRKGMFDDDDDDEEDDGRQKVELKEGSISLDQVRRQFSPQVSVLNVYTAGPAHRDAECVPVYQSVMHAILV